MVGGHEVVLVTQIALKFTRDVGIIQSLILTCFSCSGILDSSLYKLHPWAWVGGANNFERPCCLI